MRNTMRGIGVAMVVVALALTAPHAEGQVWFEGCIDSYNDTEDQEYVDAIVTPEMEVGTSYLLTVEGTISVWVSTAWNSVCLGEPEATPMFPSPGVTNGKVGIDPAFYFAIKSPSPLCSDFGYMPYPVPKFAYKLGAAGEWVRPRPEVDVYNTEHTYQYVVAGTGEAAYLSLKDLPAKDNYGQFCVTIEEINQDVEVPLCAGQTMNIGTVEVTNDADNLYVTFSVAEQGWYLEETHVAVGSTVDDIPHTKKGNPIPGQFPHACEFEPLQTSCTVTIELGDWCEGKEIVVAAHAAVAEIAGDGCDTETFWASTVIDLDQGTLKGGGDVTSGRTDPTAVFELGGPFYSLGMDMVVDGIPDAWLEVAFDHPIYNGAGADIVVQEVTNGRGSYPIELAEVFGVDDGTDYFGGIVSNKDGGTGFGTVDLPAGLKTFDSVKLLDATDPSIHASNADGFDIDAIGACYLFLGEETAWGDGCNGTRFVEKGNWGTFFTYTINGSAQSCP